MKKVNSKKHLPSILMSPPAREAISSHIARRSDMHERVRSFIASSLLHCTVTSLRYCRCAASKEHTRFLHSTRKIKLLQPKHGDHPDKAKLILESDSSDEDEDAVPDSDSEGTLSLMNLRRGPDFAAATIAAAAAPPADQPPVGGNETNRRSGGNYSAMVPRGWGRRGARRWCVRSPRRPHRVVQTRSTCVGSARRERRGLPPAVTARSP